jgi:heme/copper-type cytochrome/quinol oxidase subunit 1
MTSPQLLAILLFSLCINELLHVAFEIWGINQKVDWLNARIENQKHGKWPLEINSFLKTIALHIIAFIVITGVCMLILLRMNPSLESLLTMSVIMLIITYSFTTISVDNYHNKIGLIINRYKKR